MQPLHAGTLAVTHHQAVGQGSARDPASTRLPNPRHRPYLWIRLDGIRPGLGARKRCPPQPTKSPPWFVASTRLFPPLDGNGFAGPGSDRRQNALIHRGQGTGPGEGLERGQKLSDQDRMTPWACEDLGLMKWPGGAVDLGHRGDGC